MDEEARLDREVVETIDLAFSRIGRSQRELLALIAELDRRERWRADGCRDMTGWVAGRFHVSKWQAQRWVHAAHALEHLPRLSEALETGVLSLDKTVELARVATGDTESALIAWARRVSPAAIRRRADRAARQAIEDAQEAERCRYLRWWYFDDGNRMGLEGEFPAADGAAIAAVITRMIERFDAAAERAGAADDDDEVRPTIEQRRADALHALASGATASDPDVERATVVVRTALGALGYGELDGGPVLHPEVVRRLRCDARLQFVITDEDGNALGIGRTARAVPRWLRRELEFRDHRECTFPGCQATRFLDAHHIWAWEDGGPTELWNLTLVCHHHHKLVHEFGWNVTLNRSTTEWFRPNGSRYLPGPDPPERALVAGATRVS